MKKIIVIILILFLSAVYLSGCNGNDGERRSVCFTGSYEDFYGTWITDVKTLPIGDTIIFYQNRYCDLIWQHTSQPFYTGTWERKSNSTNHEMMVVITIGNNVTEYFYCFLSSYTKLKFREANSETYIYYTKQEEENTDTVGECNNFFGTWTTSAGSFSEGDSIKFNNENDCDNSTMEKFWSHGGAVHHYGTWERTTNATSGEYIIITTFGDKKTVYYYEFLYNYQTLGLKLENTDNYIYYNKQ